MMSITHNFESRYCNVKCSVELDFMQGIRIDIAIDEAVRACVELKSDVHFMFNGNRHEVKFIDLIDCCKKS